MQMSVLHRGVIDLYVDTLHAEIHSDRLAVITCKIKNNYRINLRVIVSNHALMKATRRGKGSSFQRNNNNNIEQSTANRKSMLYRLIELTL